MYIEIGNRLREARKSKGLTIAKLAEIIDIQNSYIAKIESGAILPSLNVFLKMINVLEVRPDYILKGIEGSYELADLPDSDIIPKSVLNLEPGDLKTLADIVEVYVKNAEIQKRLKDDELDDEE